ncbi:hypothetical protein Poli38472_006543 [Pythium oligandrum]|uniref:ZSWIM1/3 RNaseH-like domain-containing protein n=1 Tax=Pythium oligandrum TaxID=41045 RepID=A0A8K1FF82_PYTOL|nr:hypothetical protein Poli38472_006543 [Pythium oligandrum]|eukprot:TMW56533.1 hypothetical protein Poli38472_006543 [Pythium oligandrum]
MTTTTTAATAAISVLAVAASSSASPCSSSSSSPTAETASSPSSPVTVPSFALPPAKVRDVVAFEGRFPSWEAFDIARRAHCEKTHTMYVCRNTVKVDVANKRRRMQVPDDWVFDRKVFVCTHGYKRISRSSGARPRQNVRFTSCRARFTAAVVCDILDGKEVLCIKIVNQHVEHNDHPVNLEQWRNYSQNRAAIADHPYLVHEADLMRRVGSNKRAAREHIETLSGRVCTMKDMHNLFARLKKKDDAIKKTNTVATTIQENPGATLRVEMVLQQFVDANVENHASILSADDGSNEAICISTKSMKEHYEVFPELCLFDIATCHAPEMNGHQLYSLMSMDTLGNSTPVFLAQTIHTSPPLLHRVCQDFKRTHPRWSDMKLIVMSELVPLVVNVFREEFPTVRVLLCQFHVVKYFASLVTQPELGIPSPETQEHVRELLKELVFAHSERYYEDVKAYLLEQLDNRVDHPLLTHFEHHWEPYRRLWVSYWRLRSLEFSSFFSKGFEAFWNPLKHIFERSEQLGSTATAAAAAAAGATVGMTPALPASALSMVGMDAALPNGMAPVVPPVATTPAGEVFSLAKCVSEVLTMIKFIEEEWASKMLMLEMTKPVTEFSAGSVLHFLVNCLSSFAVGLVSTQLVTANTGIGGSVTILKGRAAMMRMAHTSHTGMGGVGGFHDGAIPGAPEGVDPMAAEDPLAAEGTVVYYDRAHKKRHVMKRDCSGCDCEFFVVYQLPCQHLIWYEISYLHHRQLSMSAVGQRWFLRTFQIPKLSSRKESNEIEYHIL